MNRRPRSKEDLYRWHAEALENVRLHLEVDGLTSEPECGWYKLRLVKHGPWVPARIWVEQDIDEASGELISDEVMRCEVDGQYADPGERWLWLAHNPIPESEFNYLTATRRYATDHAPNEPMADPRKAVNWLEVPTPRFGQDT